MSKHYNDCRFGRRPGGYVAALKAAQTGRKRRPGREGTPRRDLPELRVHSVQGDPGSAELMHHVQHAAEMGIDVPAGATVNWAKIQARKDKVLQTLRTGIKGLLGARKVTVLQGRAATGRTGQGGGHQAGWSA